MRDPILASKFNRLQFFPTVRVRQKLGLEIGILRPSRPSTCSPFNHSTNQCRSRVGQVAKFAKHDNSILPDCCRAGIDRARYIFLKGHFQNL